MTDTSVNLLYCSIVRSFKPIPKLERKGKALKENNGPRQYDHLYTWLTSISWFTMLSKYVDKQANAYEIVNLPTEQHFHRTKLTTAHREYRYQSKASQWTSLSREPTVLTEQRRRTKSDTDRKNWTSMEDEGRYSQTIRRKKWMSDTVESRIRLVVHWAAKAFHFNRTQLQWLSNHWTIHRQRTKKPSQKSVQSDAVLRLLESKPSFNTEVLRKGLRQGSDIPHCAPP
ncbi:hypothetical protein QR680_000563 [Steinernema hermaphroditum]|uniref:Uncharacterized protein n=1 Tax=Steinernema hermaphroditum TaxID=289476 RepID=A0AA39LDT8_9BILA|nr:hypothetical protein QR680_000563 [Steinernema hermaphroditum]